MGEPQVEIRPSRWPKPWTLVLHADGGLQGKEENGASGIESSAVGSWDGEMKNETSAASGARGPARTCRWCSSSDVFRCVDWSSSGVR